MALRKITLGDRLRYWFDSMMSRGTIVLIGWLGMVSGVLVLIISLIVLALGIAPARDDGRPLGLVGMVWFSMLRTLDPGTMGGDSGHPIFMGLMLVVTLGGIFIVSTLIGVLTSGIESKLEALRKGRSRVIEQGHTVILGWSPQVLSIISELVIANENQPKGCIAILAEKDKVEMEDTIRDHIPRTGRTKVVCRTGNPIDVNNLDIVNPAESRSVIILSSEAEDPDSLAIKTILALTNNPNRRPDPYHIVAEIRDLRNLEVAQMVARGEAQLLPVSTLISRIEVQTSRQSGLSVVYTELFDFGGDEIYFAEEPALIGKAFGDALLAYEDSAVMGLRFADGRVQLLPPMETIIQRGDRVIAVSEDDDTIRLSGMREHGIDAAAIQSPPVSKPPPERTLILGWNNRATTIIQELDNYVAPGSEVMVVAENPEIETALIRDCGELQNSRVEYVNANITDRRVLDGLSIDQYDHIITLSYSDTLGAQEADARTLVTLLHLRDISERTGKNTPVVSEMLDIRNRELAEVTRADDFIVSDKMISLMLSQVSENRDLMPVFQDLLDPEGAELYLKPAENYVQPGRSVNFYTVVEAARRRGEVAIGYRLAAQGGDASQSYGVRVNPRKSVMVTFDKADKVIVLAEN